MFWALLILNIFTLPADAKITAAECGGTIDHSSRLGSIRSQGPYGMCWAFAAAGLGEEELCLSDSKCGESLSPIDASRCSWNLGYKEQGGRVEGALKCIAGEKYGKGICLETNAPYPRSVIEIPTEKKTIEIDEIEAFIQENAVKKTQTLKMNPGLATLMDLFRNDKGIQDKLCAGNPNCEMSKVQFEKIIKQLKLDYGDAISISAFFNAVDDPVERTKELCSKLTACKDRNIYCFLSSFYLGDACTKNRFLSDFNPARAIVEDWSSSSAQVAVKQLRQILGVKNRSLAVNMCVDPIALKAAPKQENCSYHSLLITGIKWDVANMRCKVLVKNSWGADADLNGWQDADEILNSIKEATYLAPKTYSEQEKFKAPEWPKK